jgi:hypothetical protein
MIQDIVLCAISAIGVAFLLRFLAALWIDTRKPRSVRLILVRNCGGTAQSNEAAQRNDRRMSA